MTISRSARDEKLRSFSLWVSLLVANLVMGETRYLGQKLMVCCICISASGASSVANPQLPSCVCYYVVKSYQVILSRKKWFLIFHCVFSFCFVFPSADEVLFQLRQLLSTWHPRLRRKKDHKKVNNHLLCPKLSQALKLFCWKGCLQGICVHSETIWRMLGILSISLDCVAVICIINVLGHQRES